MNGEPYPNAITFGISDKGVYDKVIDKMKTLLAKMKKQAEEAGVEKVVTNVMVGNAKVALTETYPVDHQIDLILVGERG